MNNFPVVDSWINHYTVELKIDKDEKKWCTTFYAELSNNCWIIKTCYKAYYLVPTISHYVPKLNSALIKWKREQCI